MALNNFRVISVISSAAICLLILIFVPLKINFILKKAEKKIISVQKKNIFFQILVMIFSALLIFFVLLRDLGILTDIVVCLVAILGWSMSLNEIFMNRFCGLYEKGLVGNGRFLPFEQIIALKTSTNSNDEMENIDPRILILTTEKNSSEQFIFSSEEEKISVQNEILNRNPRLVR